VTGGGATATGLGGGATGVTHPLSAAIEIAATIVQRRRMTGMENSLERQI
jgi:hypothetical protein